MPTYLASIFGRSKPTSPAARAALDRVEADLANAPDRIAAAEAALHDVAGMSDAEHATAEAERDAARRSLARLAAQAEALRGTLADAEKADDAAALAARAKAAGAKLAGYEGLIREHDARAKALAETLAEMADVEAEIAACNRAIAEARRAGLAAPDEVATPDEVFRAEPDVVTPDRFVIEEKVQFREDGRWLDVSVTEKREGRQVLHAGDQIRQIERVIRGRVKPGRRISSPTGETVLAPARIGSPAFWPRSA